MTDSSLYARTRRTLLVCLALLLVFFARSYWIGQYGYRLPYWDEIGAELVAAAGRTPGTLPPIKELAAPHNEHRVLWQRLLGIGLLEANDRIWDSQARCIANAVFSALAAVVLAAALRGKFDGRIGTLLYWPPVLLMASPIAYQNLLFSFQTSFHLQLLFSLGALAWIPGAHPRMPRWWVGLAFGLAALFTSGSGFFTAPVLLCWVGIDMLRCGTPRAPVLSSVVAMLRARWPTILAALMILVPGLLLIHRPDATSNMGASGAGEFLLGLSRHLAWPWSSAWLAPLCWLPMALLAWRVLRGADGEKWLASARVALCTGGWVMLNLLAMAWLRGANAIGPVPRYEDFHLLGLAINAASLVLLGVVWRTAASSAARRAGGVVIALWSISALAGSALLAHAALRVEMPDFRAFGALQESNVAAYTVGRDVSVFNGYISRYHLPYPEPDQLRQWLDDSRVVALLPAPFHADLAVMATAEASGACSTPCLPAGIAPPPGERLWISSFSRSDNQQGRFRSGLIHATGNSMRLWYLGMESGGSLKLRLVPEGAGKAVNILSDRRHGTSRWLPITVPVVRGKSYRVEFSDRSELGWAAFTLPVPEPPLSRRAEWLCLHADTLLWLTIGMLLLTAAAPICNPTRT